MEMKNLLFICSRNKKRSLTAEHHFAERGDWNVASAGFNKDSATPVTPELLEWADVIFVMEPDHRSKLSRNYRDYLNRQRVICLNIADKYEYMADGLIDELERKVHLHL